MLSMRTLSQHEKEMCKRAIDNARILKNEQNVIQLEQELADCKAAAAHGSPLGDLVAGAGLGEEAGLYL